MQLIKCLAIAACASITTACGENSTRQASESDTTKAVSITKEKVTDTIVNIDYFGVNVPEPTRNAFQAKYPHATNVIWRKYEPVIRFEWDWAGWPALDTGDYVVNYTMDGREYLTWYDDNNNWIGTVSSLSNQSELPAAVNNKIQKEYPGYTIISIDKENDKDRTAYEIELAKGGDRTKALIDANGKILKKKARANG